jgi:hypothetical protein
VKDHDLCFPGYKGRSPARRKPIGSYRGGQPKSRQAAINPKANIALRRPLPHIGAAPIAACASGFGP